MDDLTPVKGPPTPFEGRSAKVMALVIVFLLVALIKPWGDGSQAVAPPVTASATASATPVAEATSPASLDPWANYDHEIFGIYEPEPRWELWPAGYLVSFGYAIRIESTPAGAPERRRVAGARRVRGAGRVRGARCVRAACSIRDAGRDTTAAASPRPSVAPLRPARPPTASRSGRRRSGSPMAITSASSASTCRSGTG